MTFVSIDFKFIPHEKAMISIFDRGFLLGDSVYEVFRIYPEGRPFMLEEHFKRLKKSASQIELNIPFDFQTFNKHVYDLIQTSGYTSSYCRVIVTRGIWDFNLFPDNVKSSKVIFILNKFKEYNKEFYEKGIKMAIVSIRRNHPSSLNPNIKSGNYLNNILAIKEARKKGAMDAIMLNHKGYVAESTTSNIFIVKNGVLFTPDLRAGILNGITRSIVIKLARLNKIPIKIKNFTKHKLINADECFITSTTKEIMPVTICDNLPIGNGKVGIITKKLMNLFKEKGRYFNKI